MSALILPYRGIRPRIAAGVYVAPTATLIGDVEIGEDTNIWFGCVLRGDVNVIRVGRRTNIQDGTVVHVSRHEHGTFMGDDITIGHMALIHACTLEDRCFIGMKACVMDGVQVEGGSMVAAGALVTPGKTVRSGELWAGSPARCIRQLRDDELAAFPGQAAHYVRLAKEYLAADLS